MDKFIETYGERPDGHGGLPTMTTRAQDTWDALRAAYELGRRETEIDPHIDGVVPQPITYEEEFFLSGMLAIPPGYSLIQSLIAALAAASFCSPGRFFNRQVA